MKAEEEFAEKYFPIYRSYRRKATIEWFSRTMKGGEK
jgi:hypothetical protein